MHWDRGQHTRCLLLLCSVLFLSQARGTDVYLNVCGYCGWTLVWLRLGKNCVFFVNVSTCGGRQQKNGRRIKDDIRQRARSRGRIGAQNHCSLFELNLYFSFYDAKTHVEIITRTQRHHYLDFESFPPPYHGKHHQFFPSYLLSLDLSSFLWRLCRLSSFDFVLNCPYTVSSRCYYLISVPPSLQQTWT